LRLHQPRSQSSGSQSRGWHWRLFAQTLQYESEGPRESETTSEAPGCSLDSCLVELQLKWLRVLPNGLCRFEVLDTTDVFAVDQRVRVCPRSSPPGQNPAACLH